MQITNVKISTKEIPNTNIIGQASCVVNGTIAVNSITIRKTNDGQLYVQMPQMKNTKTDKYQDIAFPLTADGRKQINEVILNHFNNKDISQQKTNAECSSNIQVSLFNTNSNNEATSSLLARGSMSIDNEFVIKNVKVVVSKNGEPFMALPSSYNKSTKKSYSIIAPATKEAYKLLSNATLSAYKNNLLSTESYHFIELSEEQIEILSRNTDIKFDCGNINESGNCIVRINSADRAKAENALNLSVATQKK